MPEQSSRIRRWVRGLFLLAVVGFAGEQAWRHGHDYVFPEKFRVVEPGKIYRGAWQKPFPMKRLLRDHKIKTVIALAHAPGDPLPTQEQKLVEAEGVRWIHLPIYYSDHHTAKESEMGDRLEEVAALLADPANQPVYFHCHHGVNRTSMAQIAYRTLVCGWPLDRAKAEVERMTGWKHSALGTGEEYMDRFYTERVEPRRQPVPEPLAKAGETTSR